MAKRKIPTTNEEVQEEVDTDIKSAALIIADIESKLKYNDAQNKSLENGELMDSKRLWKKPSLIWMMN
jgi:hypothetical protein